MKSFIFTILFIIVDIVVIFYVFNIFITRLETDTYSWGYNTASAVVLPESK